MPRSEIIKVFCFFFSKKKFLLPFLLLALTAAAPRSQSPADAAAKSAGCISCHTASDAATMHTSQAVILGCADCHGGNASVMRPPGTGPGFGPSRARADGLSGHAPPIVRDPDPAYRAAMDRAHVLPLHPDAWNTPVSAVIRS
jgi:hypothetical protein